MFGWLNLIIVVYDFDMFLMLQFSSCVVVFQFLHVVVSEDKIVIGSLKFFNENSYGLLIRFLLSSELTKHWLVTSIFWNLAILFFFFWVHSMSYFLDSIWCKLSFLYFFLWWYASTGILLLWNLHCLLYLWKKSLCNLILFYLFCLLVDLFLLLNRIQMSLHNIILSLHARPAAIARLARKPPCLAKEKASSSNPNKRKQSWA